MDKIVDIVTKIPNYRMVITIATLVLLLCGIAGILIPAIRDAVVQRTAKKKQLEKDFVTQTYTRYVSDHFSNKLGKWFDETYKYSRVYTKKTSSTSWKYFTDTLAISVFASLVGAIFTTGIFGIFLFIFTWIARYGYLTVLKVLNAHQVEGEMVMFLNMLANYSTGNTEIISTFASIAYKFKPVLQSCLMECVRESQGAGGTLSALENLGRKIECRKFKEILKSLEICQRFSGGFATAVQALRRDTQGYLAEKRKLNELIKQNMITLLIVVIAMVIMIGVLGATLGEDIWSKFTEPIGLIILGLFVAVCVWFVGEIIKVNN